MKIPKKNEKPNTNLVLKLLRLQNWRKPRPAEATNISKLTNIVKFFNICVDKKPQKAQRLVLLA
jgi:hypothetical protein